MEPEAALERLRPYIDALEARMDVLQSLIRERHGELSDEYDEAKWCYRLAAGLHVELTRLDNDLKVC
jgi:hypothetical protein